MQREEGESVRARMESLQLKCDREISFQQQKMESFASSFLQSLNSMKAKAQDTVQIQGNLSKMKSSLKEAEDKLVQALAVKNRKEAKRMATMDSISAVKARVEGLERIVQDQKARKDEYAAIISQEFLALAAVEEKTEQEMEKMGETKEAISWYNRILGFHIEGGNGVKFTFNNIDAERPDKAYSFTVRHSNDMYILLECDPAVDSAKELIRELNKSNDLYNFIRIMRRKFLEVAGQESSLQMIDLRQDTTNIAMSGPVASFSTDTSESSAMTEDHLQHMEVVRNIKKVDHRRASKAEILSPGSSSSLRRSSRSKVKK